MEAIWENIKRHEGEVFYTVSGLEFTYQVVGEKLIHTRSKVAISKSAFEKYSKTAAYSAPIFVGNTY